MDEGDAWQGQGARRRVRASTACTVCRQIKTKCDRPERLPNRCSRCERTNSVCEVSNTFRRRRVKGGSHPDENTRLRQELDELKAEVAFLRTQRLPDSGNPSAASGLPDVRAIREQRDHTTASRSPSSSTPDADAERRRLRGHVAHDTATGTATLARITPDHITLMPSQINAAFAAFFIHMHPLLPFLTEHSPNAAYEREPFLFWTICSLGLRSVDANLAHTLDAHVASEALAAPQRSCHSQVAGTAVVQSLLLLALWPLRSPSLLHEHVWLHGGTAAHLALHIGLHQPYSASEFVPKDERAHIPLLVTEFRRTWIACYVVNCLVAFARGHPLTVRADFNLVEYSSSSPEQLGVERRLFAFLLLARCIEDAYALGNPALAAHGLLPPRAREAVYELLQSRISEAERTMGSPSDSYMTVFVAAVRLLPVIQVLRSTSRLPLQETAVVAGMRHAEELISAAELVRSQINAVHLPVYVDGLVLMAALLVFKFQISMFSGLVDAHAAQQLIASTCAYYRSGINGFSTIPARLTIFMDGLRPMALEGKHLSSGGFVIETARCHYAQNILYEVLWDFYDWAQKKVGAPEFQTASGHVDDHAHHHGDNGEDSGRAVAAQCTTTDMLGAMGTGNGGMIDWASLLGMDLFDPGEY